MKLCSKKYVDIPFAHRQPNHAGHCRTIHGHNWTFEFLFAAENTDECGFVVDFGALKPLKEALDKLDHALVLNGDDPLAESIGVFTDKWGIGNVVLVEDCSAEGMAEWAYREATAVVEELTEGRAFVKQVRVYEDSKNSAYYYRGDSR